MDYSKLKDELTDDPLARGYSGMSDTAAAVDLNTAYREQDRTTMTGSEVLNAVDMPEYEALTDANNDKLWQVLHLGTINPFGVEATLLIAIFGAESDTITALAAARKTMISRATELGLGRVKAGYIQAARS